MEKHLYDSKCPFNKKKSDNFHYMYMIRNPEIEVHKYLTSCEEIYSLYHKNVPRKSHVTKILQAILLPQ